VNVVTFKFCFQNKCVQQKVILHMLVKTTNLKNIADIMTKQSPGTQSTKHCTNALGMANGDKTADTVLLLSGAESVSGSNLYIDDSLKGLK
jgi:hypothetical protein